MAWCHQATNHCLNLCLPRSMLQYGVTRLQWVNIYSNRKYDVKIIYTVYFTRNTWPRKSLLPMSRNFSSLQSENLITNKMLYLRYIAYGVKYILVPWIARALWSTQIGGAICIFMLMPTWVFLGHVALVLHIPQKGFLKLQTQAPVRTQPGYGPWLAAHSWRSSGPAGPTQTLQPSPTSGPGQQTSTQTKFVQQEHIPAPYQVHMGFEKIEITLYSRWVLEAIRNGRANTTMKSNHVIQVYVNWIK